MTIRLADTPGSLLTALVVAALAACVDQTARDRAVANGDAPLAALRVPVHSTRYTQQYWTDAATTNPAQWQAAVQFCEAQVRERNGQAVNCTAVLDAETVVQARTTGRSSP